MTAWFVALRPESAGGVRVVVFPHAGGGPASASSLVPLLPDHIDPWSVNLPGRQVRLAEPPRTGLGPLVADLADDLARTAPQRYALFGYCSGALLAYLVCRRAGALGRPPSLLLVASFAAPDVAVPLRRLHLLPSTLFWERLIEYGGVPRELAERTELRPILEPALRADFAMLAEYRHAPGPPMSTPITSLYGRRDTSLSRGSLLGWRRQTQGRFTLQEIDASHWLIDDAPDAVADTIAAELSRPPARRARAE